MWEPADNVVALPAVPPGVPSPQYDRSAVRTGIVHIGVGGFHRAHQAMYLDRLMTLGQASDWGICGVGVLAQDIHMRDALRGQDHLYTLVVKHPDGRLEPRVIGSMVDYLYAPEDPAAVVERMAAPSTRIVSLTVTEGGYHVHPATRQLDPDDPGLEADVAALIAGRPPRTAFGLVVAALRARRDRGVSPFTVQSCDNVQDNGHVAQRMIASWAGLIDEGLGRWIADEVAFPNSMVDRITPVTTDADRSELRTRFGLVDAWPVVCEPFTQWVIEDHFPSGRPRWEDVGGQLVDDVAPYELMKLRLLNAGHQAIAYLGRLGGYTFAHEAASDPHIAAYARRYMDREATPTLLPVPGVDLDEYKSTLLVRFANPQVRDTLARLGAETSDRIPTWVLPVVRERLAAGHSPVDAALLVASWARYCEGVDDAGRPIEVVDRVAARLIVAAGRHDQDELAFLRDRDLFGDLVDHEAFTRPYLAALRSLRSQGALATTAAWLEST